MGDLIGCSLAAALFLDGGHPAHTLAFDTLARGGVADRQLLHLALTDEALSLEQAGLND